MGRVEPGERAQQIISSEMGGAADSRRRVGQVPAALGGTNQLWQRARGVRHMNGEQSWRRADERDWRVVFERVESWILVEARVDRQRGGMNEQRITVGRR